MSAADKVGDHPRWLRKSTALYATRGTRLPAARIALWSPVQDHRPAGTRNELSRRRPHRRDSIRVAVHHRQRHAVRGRGADAAGRSQHASLLSPIGPEAADDLTSLIRYVAPDQATGDPGGRASRAGRGRMVRQRTRVARPRRPGDRRRTQAAGPGRGDHGQRKGAAMRPMPRREVAGRTYMRKSTRAVR